MTSQPFGLQHSIRFGEEFELDLRPRRLRRGSHVLKLERIPLEILILLVEHRGEIVSRETIVARVWGNDVFLDMDNSIRGAIRKIRQALKDDPETPQFIQTVVELDPNFAAAHLLLGEAIVGQGCVAKLSSSYKKRQVFQATAYSAQVGVALAVAGRKNEALRIAHELEIMWRKRYVSPYGLAQIYAAADKNEDTFKWLQAAYDDHAAWMGYLAVDPIFDRYRSDARFKDLLRRVGLP